MPKGIEDLVVDELHDLLSTEEQFADLLPGVLHAAEDPKLKETFSLYLKETRGQIQRLKKVFKLLKIERKGKICKGMKGLVQECQAVLSQFKKKSALRDAALISKIQRIKHYEISVYGTLRTWAVEINLHAIADLLQETLKEEAYADKKLSKIAEGSLLRTGINHQANVMSEVHSKKLNHRLTPRRKPSQSSAFRRHRY